MNRLYQFHYCLNYIPKFYKSLIQINHLYDPVSKMLYYDRIKVNKHFIFPYRFLSNWSTRSVKKLS